MATLNITGLGQYNSLGEYCDPHTAFSVFIFNAQLNHFSVHMFCLHYLVTNLKYSFLNSTGNTSCYSLPEGSNKHLIESRGAGFGALRTEIYILSI